MNRLNNVSGRQAMRVAEQRGWRLDRVRGDHYIYKSANERRSLPVPDHRELAEGTLRAIIRSLGLTVDEFLAALKQ